MLVTCHWSATGPNRLCDYHVQFGLTGVLTASLRGESVRAHQPGEVDWPTLKFLFAIYKNVDLGTATDFGTWHLNHDPRDGSANIEIGALCMGGEDVGVAGPWGAYPYTIAHAWMHAGIVARLCKLNGIDCNGSFDVNVESSVLQNGPIYNVSTHGERALQTKDSAAVARPSFGYFAYSGDGDCRWDIAVRDESEAHVLATGRRALERDRDRDGGVDPPAGASHQDRRHHRLLGPRRRHHAVMAAYWTKILARVERSTLTADVQAAGVQGPASLATINAKVEHIVPAFLRPYVEAKLQALEAQENAKLSADPAAAVDLVINALKKAQAKLTA